MSNPGSCSLSYPYAGETASVEGTASFSMVSDSNAIEFSGGFSGSSVFAGGFTTQAEPFYGVDGYSTTQVVAQGIFKTPGPVRPGILIIEAQYAFTTLDVDRASLSFSIAGHSDGFGLTTNSPIVDLDWAFPVELGRQFDFLLRFDSIVQSSSAYSVNGNAMGHTTFRVSAFDLNDQPVAISAVPEPSAGTLCFICLVAIFLAKKIGSS